MKREKKAGKKRGWKKALKIAGITVAAFWGALILAFLFMLYGPAHTLRDYFVLTMKETSALKFVPDLFFGDEKIARILEANRLIVPDENTDPSLIAGGTTPPETSPAETKDPEGGSLPPATAPPVTEPPPETTGAADLYKDHPDAMEEAADLPGIAVVRLSGPTYNGYMMIVSDPSRVTLGVSQKIIETYESGNHWDSSRGEKLKSIAARYGAAAAVNGGAFYDPEGKGNGGRPEGVLCSGGRLLYWGPEEVAIMEYEAEQKRIADLLQNGEITAEQAEKMAPVLKDSSSRKINIIGINNDNVLVLGRYTKEEFLELNIRDAVSFVYPSPPFLIVNGKPSQVVGTGGSGIQPRTCIGQRADGAFLFLVIDGRGAGGSIGATIKEAMEIMQEFGAVNASNLDGGSSSELILNGATVSKPASYWGPRSMPDGFIVR